MNSSIQFQKFLQIEKWKWLLVVGLLAITHILCQSLMLPYGKALVSLLPDGETTIREKVHFSSGQPSSKIGDDPIIDKALNFINASLLVRGVKSADNSNMVEEADDDDGPKPDGKRNGNNFISDSRDPDDGFDFVEDADVENDMPFEEPVDVDLGLPVENGNHSVDFVLEKRIETGNTISLKQVMKPNNQNISDGMLKTGDSMTQDRGISDMKSLLSPSDVLPSTESSSNTTYLKSLTSSISTSGGSAHNISPTGRRKIVSPDNGNNKLLQLESAYASNDSALIGTPVKKKIRCEMPPKTVTSINEMERLLVRHRTRSRAMKPRWSSERDKEILAAKLQIENAPLIRNDRELYAPLFRNLSMFKRSYELMERILKVYVYKDGEKPIFHQPVLKGLYASEGWFMKLMEGNKRFTVKDPRRAHLFYMPFSSRMLEHALYVRNSHNRTNLRQYLKDYSEKIAAKYRFWNRTGGADHFLVACHDWAPYETRHHMEHCIKALCNADVTIGFKIGRDISLPETYVRAARNPLRDLGGKPPSQRHILAFYAGNMHGYLRPILLKYWKDKDPDMKLFGPMPPGVASKMNYIQHMKSSKYCICPKGYEVNSPRVVEAIFYECVPVIISDNFVPPFFEVLNWNAFSVILAEKDIPNLKDILLSIPEQRYLELQLGVRKVQQHFLWHAKPLRYDLFHMTLHSIWYNRVFQIKVR